MMLVDEPLFTILQTNDLIFLRNKERKLKNINRKKSIK